MVIHNRISVQYVSQEREDMNNKCVCVCVCVCVCKCAFCKFTN